MRTTLSLFAAAALLAPAAPAFAESSPQIPIQGYFTDADGVPVDGYVDMSFTLYADEHGSEAVVHREARKVWFHDGTFAVYLGGGNVALDAAIFRAYDALWLGIAPGGGPEMSPRVALAPQPFALSARFAADAASLDGFTADAFARVEDLTWGALGGIPEDMADGDQDTLASIACQDGFYLRWTSADGWRCVDPKSMVEAALESHFALHDYAPGALAVEVGELADRVTVIHDRIDSLGDGITANAEAFASHVDAFMTYTETIADQLAAFGDVLVGLDDAVAGFQADLQGIMASVAGVDARVGQAEVKAAQDFAYLDGRLAAVEVTSQAAATALADQSEGIAVLDVKFNVTAAEVATMKTAFDMTSLDVLANASALDGQADAIHNLTAELAATNAATVALLQANLAAQATLTAQSERIDALEAQLAALQAQVDPMGSQPAP